MVVSGRVGGIHQVVDLGVLALRRAERSAAVSVSEPRERVSNLFEREARVVLRLRARALFSPHSLFSLYLSCSLACSLARSFARTLSLSLSLRMYVCMYIYMYIHI